MRGTVTGSPPHDRPFRATAADLPAAVRAAFQHPGDPRRTTVEAAGLRWSALEWGDPADRPLLLLHGVTASARIWWRVGPAIAATGRRVVAPDLPGHGRTGGWQGRHRIVDTARDVVAFARAAGAEHTELDVVGHSWGAMIAATLPSAGLVPARLVLLDPPFLDTDRLATLAADPSYQPFEDVDEARAALRAGNPSWAPGDVEAKAEAIVQLQPEAAREVLLGNGDWDAGLAALRHPAAAGLPAWLIRGEAANGGLIPEHRLPALIDRLGADHVITLAGAPHAPQRTHPEATIAALLRALVPTPEPPGP